MTDPIVETAAGKLRGVSSNGVCIFRGIPYASAERFRRASAPEPWIGVRDAIHFGPAAPQIVRSNDSALPELEGAFWRLGMGAQTGLGLREDIQSEDCLVLNVWTPAIDQRRRPVMIWLHGGGWSVGSGARPAVEGTALSRYGDVVVVTINHRVGILGNLELGEFFGSEWEGSGNNSMLDLVAALTWVRNNIAQFGGDPDNVTVTGSSGGGAKTWTLLSMPAAQGLVHRAAILNGYLMWHRKPPEYPGLATAALLKELDVGPGQIDKLLTLPASAFVQAGGRALARLPAISSFPSTLPEGLWFAPVIGSKEVPEFPTDAIAAGSAKSVPILIEKACFEHFDATAFPGIQFGWIDDAQLRTCVRQWHCWTRASTG